MNATITLLIYWSIAAGLIGGGLFALAKGCKLVREGRGQTREESSIEFFKIKVTISSIGALVMVTAFMWGWAAVLALPNYKDSLVEIRALRQDVEQKESVLASLRTEHSALEEGMTAVGAQLEFAESALARTQNQLRTLQAASGNKGEVERQVKGGLAEQRRIFTELQRAIEEGDQSKIKENFRKLEATTTAVEKSIEEAVGLHFRKLDIEEVGALRRMPD